VSSNISTPPKLETKAKEIPMDIKAEVIRLRRENQALSLTEIAKLLDTDRDYVAQVIAKARRKGIDVPAGTSTSKGHVGKYTFKLKQ
jgi:biotin operon repressor